MPSGLPAPHGQDSLCPKTHFKKAKEESIACFGVYGLGV